MAYVQIWVHCVWGTKNRIAYLTPVVLQELIPHIADNAKEKGIYLDTINGHNDHIHCIISLEPDQTLARVMQLIKGESSFWLNRKKLTRCRFEWAVEYYCVSFGKSDLEKVRLYIRNQQSHHAKKSWEDECNDIIEKYSFVRYNP